MMLLSPMTIKQTTFKNRVVMSPMCMYSVEKQDGVATEFHYNHYVTRAVGGVGYIMIESTAVLPNGRISYEDLGLWDDSQIEPLKRIVNEVHKYGAKIGIQLSHAGRKSRTKDIVSSSPIQFSSRYAVPKMLSIEEIKDIVKAFGEAARRANEAGFDSIELHGAHGYLINQFISDLTNTREDIYKDGTLFLKEVIDEVSKNFPKEKILQIRVSGYEYHQLGLTPYDWASILNNFKHQLDLVNVSSGGTVEATIDDYPGYQLPYARIIKEETHMLVLGGGQLDDEVLAEEALKHGDIDMVYFGRKLLKDPYFIYKLDESLLPKQYVRATSLKKRLNEGRKTL